MPVFLIATVLVAVSRTFTEPKFTAFGAIDILGGGAVAESFTLNAGLLGSFEEMLTIALFFPNGVVDSNSTFI